MENNPGDSSSESDIADHWSIIDRDSCEPEYIPVDNVVKERDSICEETSDGESLEVIGEEEKHEDEYKDADMETDGISIISESGSSSELEQPLFLAVSKEKKYIHHPNRYLNTRLNVLLAVSFAAVTGLGLGHFLGLQEECPLLNESTTNLVAKLQHENQLLQYKIEKLMSEKDAAAPLIKHIQEWECGKETKLRNEGILHLHPSFQAGIDEHPLSLEIGGFNGIDMGSQQHTSDIRNFYEDEVRNVAKMSPVVGVGRVVVDENAEYVRPVKYEEETVLKPPPDKKRESVSSESSIEYVILTDHKDQFTAVNMQQAERNSVSDFTDHVDGVTFEQLRVHDGIAKFSVDLSGGGNVEESYILVNKLEAVPDLSSLVKDEKNSKGSSFKNDGVAQPAGQVKDKGSVYPVKDGPFVFEHTLNTHPSGGDTITDRNRNFDSLQPDVIKETHDWKENNIEIIKSTLKLLQSQYDDVASTNTGRILSSSIALATEVEQSLVHLQDTVTRCEGQKTDFCAQFQKRVEVSVSKLKETAKGLVNDIDEQLYKLISTVVRKLKKFKGKLQDKWCYLIDKYDYDNDAIYNWLHSAILLDCKESERQTRGKLKKFSAKELHKLNEKFVRSTSEKNQKGTYIPNILKSHDAKEEYDFKSVESNIASEVDKKYTIPVPEHHINNKKRHNKVIINHDNLNEQNFKINVPVSAPEEPGKSTGQEQYMSESQTNLKHDNGGILRRRFNGKEINEHGNKQKSVSQSKTCWQAHNGRAVCHKYIGKQQVMHSESFEGQDCKDNHWHEKNNLKTQFNDKKKKEYKKHETQHSWHNEKKHHKQAVILEQDASWILDDGNNPKQNNMSGDWLLKMANDRAEQRKLAHRSDWVFDRADARKLKRERQHLTDNWYFQRAHEREYCRYHPQSDWCKTGIYSGSNYDWLHKRDYENRYHEDGRLRHGPRWTNKFIPRSFAATGKMIKDSFTYFQNKMNYHSHR